MFDPFESLYIHIPFCKKRCNYCDFYSHACAKDSHEIESYLEDLLLSLRKNHAKGRLDHISTIYIGGGTPTYIGHSRLINLIYVISLWVDLGKEDFEFTIEANPDSLDESLCKDLYALGVNRISLGIQSLDDAVLATLGRIHNADQAKEALRVVTSRFSNYSIDLICGIPGQLTSSFARSLRYVLDLKVPHISIYPLSVEEHTPLEHMIHTGEIADIDENMQVEQMELAQTLLKEHGYIHYEISNYALPGYESKHNSRYWKGIPYLGLGKGAVTMAQNETHRIRLLDGHIQDTLSAHERRIEDVILGLRMKCGFSDAELKEFEKEEPQLRQIFESLLNQGLLKYQGRRWYVSSQGFYFANMIFKEIYELN